MKLKNLILYSFALMLILTYSSCQKLSMSNGNGHLLSETRQLVPFTEIINEGEFHIFIEEDTISQAIVEAESNIIPLIRTIVNGNTLIIDSRGAINPSIPITIYLKTPKINSIKLSGSGSIETDSISTVDFSAKISGSGIINAKVSATTVSAEISGSGNINLISAANYTNVDISGSGYIFMWGSSTDSDFRISGSGDINSYDFTQNNLEAKISGSGNMYVNVIDYLKVKISGSGSVYYMGVPSLDVNITGSGSVIHQ